MLDHTGWGLQIRRNAGHCGCAVWVQACRCYQSESRIMTSGSTRQILAFCHAWAWTLGWNNPLQWTRFWKPKNRNPSVSLAVLFFCGLTAHSAVFLNRRAAVRYLALVSIIPAREKFSWNLSF